AATAMLGDLKGDIQTALTDVRRLVYALRPPALDELGLIGALRLHLGQTAHGGLRITIDASDDLPPLSAAVEVAAYRIIMEAVTNVRRHAQAQSCSIRITAQDMLEVEIADDGKGLPEDVRAGIGFISMRERAAELGGTCTITGGATKGTIVRATLPF
ncbi:MAG TPA: ATP-binding protein, partial [Herpetosiphonaceae bacterium]|nr:ATP-binding protein [Herpetosiphonaceae bacterium]